MGWGFAKSGKLNALKIKQKMAIRKVFNLKYRDHTNSYFANSHILKLDNLIKHTTLCYMNSGLQVKSASHIKELWNIKNNGREGLRSTYSKINPIISSRQWINDLPPNRQAGLWNKSELEIPVQVRGIFPDFHFQPEATLFQISTID